MVWLAVDVHALLLGFFGRISCLHARGPFELTCDSVEYTILKNKTHMGSLADHTCRLKTKVKEISKPSYAVHSFKHASLHTITQTFNCTHHINHLLMITD